MGRKARHYAAAKPLACMRAIECKALTKPSALLRVRFGKSRGFLLLALFLHSRPDFGFVNGFVIGFVRQLSARFANALKLRASMILSEANQVAIALWPEVENENDLPDTSDNWVQLAINSPSGVLAEYWLGSIELWRKGKESKTRYNG